MLSRESRDVIWPPYPDTPGPLVNLEPRQFTASVDGKIHPMRVSELANGWGITTRIENLLENDSNNAVLCDWTNVLQFPESVRLHMFNGAKRDVAFDVKNARMKSFAGVISTLDELMQDVDGPLTMEQLSHLMESGTLPRPAFAVLDTARTSLRKILTQLKFFESKHPPHPFVAPWRKLAQRAKSGEFVECWQKQQLSYLAGKS